MIPCASPLRGGNSSAAERPDVIPAATGLHRELSGKTLRHLAIGPFTLTENSYPAGLHLPKHSHTTGHLTFVIEGSFRETYAASSMVCRAGSLRFLPEGEVHEDQIETALRCLHVVSDARVFDQIERKSAVPRQPTLINGLAASWLGNRLYAEFCREDGASAIAIEGLLLEIFAEMARADSVPDRRSLPVWLQRATEIVEARFLERLSLAEIASEVGVHYVHLSRQFHKYNRCTIGELIRRLRVQYASHLLAHTETPLAEIALICSFSDQSHLSFLFKRYMGLSPSKFRSLAGQRTARTPQQTSDSGSAL